MGRRFNALLILAFVACSALASLQDADIDSRSDVLAPPSVAQNASPITRSLVQNTQEASKRGNSPLSHARSTAPGSSPLDPALTRRTIEDIVGEVLQRSEGGVASNGNAVARKFPRKTRNLGELLRRDSKYYTRGIQNIDLVQRAEQVGSNVLGRDITSLDELSIRELREVYEQSPVFRRTLGKVALPVFGRSSEDYEDIVERAPILQLFAALGRLAGKGGSRAIREKNS